MENILKNIIDKKKEKIKIFINERSESKLFNDIKNINNFIDFKSKIKQRNLEQKISIIAEIKKASPSAGVIVKNFNPLNIAKIYIENGASFLSVLAEEDFFLGKLDHISDIKKKINLPILCKDFFIDTFQVYLAKSYGADAILIILAGLNNDLANKIYLEASKLNMSVIVEVHTLEEASRALNFKNALIGINNRNLKTLKTNIKNFLIGESLLKNLEKNSILSVLK